MPELYIRHHNTSCKQCGTSIYRRPNQILRNDGNVFCSQTCSAISQRREVPCLVCSAPILSGLNKKTCSRSCANIHRSGIKYGTGAIKDKVKSQRALKLRIVNIRGGTCERCGYNKVEILQIHHKDRNRANNEPNNLELICPNCHCEEHFVNK